MRSRRKSEALRTCLGCRNARSRKELLRMVRGIDGVAVFDLGGRLPGRGAYVCPCSSCLKSLRQSSLSHVLRAEVKLAGYEDLRESLLVSLRRQVGDLLTIGRKAGHLAVGAEAVRDALDRNRVELLLAAADASPRTLAALPAAGHSFPVARPGDKALLGTWLGRKSVAVAALTDRGLALRMVFLLDRLTGIERNSYHGVAKIPEEV